MLNPADPNDLTPDVCGDSDSDSCGPDEFRRGEMATVRIFATPEVAQQSAFRGAWHGPWCPGLHLAPAGVAD